MSWECQWEGRDVEWGVYSAGRLKHCMYLCVIVNVYAITIVRISEKPSVVNLTIWSLFTGAAPNWGSQEKGSDECSERDTTLDYQGKED